MSTQYRIDKDLSEARKMVDAFEEYLRGEDVYGNTSGMFGSGDTPALTTGALVMRLRRLKVLRDKLSSSQQQELDSISAKHDTIQKEWANRYETKVLKEAKSRLDAMNTFFSECKENPRTCQANYLPEVQRRTIVQELLNVMRDRRIPTTDIQAKLAATDAGLRSIITPASFQWDKQLEPAYPQDEFWWMYQTPPASDDKGNGQ